MQCVPRTKRLLIAGLLSACALVGGTAQVEEKANYRPKLAVSETLEPFLKQLEPGSDGFPLERQAQELDARLRELSEALRSGGARAAGVTKGLLDPGFRGARLLPIEGAATSQAPLDVQRAKDLPRDPTLDARAFGAELRRLIDDFRDVAVAELLITSIEPDGPADSPSGLRTTVRYDIVGAGTKVYRAEHVGEWEMGWRRNASGWQVVRWTATSHLVSRARHPIFTEITEAALGGNDSFRRQLNIDLDSWMATFDSVLTREQIRSIVDILMDRVKREIRGQGMTLTITEAARELLSVEGYDPQYGARPLRRAISRLVEDPLSDDMLRGKFKAGDEIVLDVRQGIVVFEKRREPVAADTGA